MNRRKSKAKVDAGASAPAGGTPLDDFFAAQQAAQEQLNAALASISAADAPFLKDALELQQKETERALRQLDDLNKGGDSQ